MHIRLALATTVTGIRRGLKSEGPIFLVMATFWQLCYLIIGLNAPLMTIYGFNSAGLTYRLLPVQR